MKQTIYDEKTGLWYELRGEYYYPYLTVPDETERPIGIWGQRHLRYLKQHKKSAYHELLRSGRLHSYLEEIDRQAEAMLERLIEQISYIVHSYRMKRAVSYDTRLKTTE